MPAFGNHKAVEDRVKAKIKDKTWVVAHAARNKNGVLVARVYRFSSPGNYTTGWVELTDDASV